MSDKAGKARRGVDLAAHAMAAVIFVSFVLAWLGLFSLPVSGEVDQAGMLPQIITFQISPTGIVRGETAILTWREENAVVVNIDQNVGDVTPSGQLTVKPDYSTTYKITVSNNVGIRTRYLTLQVAEVAPDAPDTVAVDPVTGRNSSVDLSWEDYCYSSDYQVQIARDAAFTLKVYDSGILQPADSVSPAFSYPPGRLEAGHTYYWRVRTTRSVTGQWAISPWSEARPFTVEPGFPVRANSYGVQALSPVNNSAGGVGGADVASNTNKPSQKEPLAPADAPAWAIAVIIFGSLLIGMVVAFTLREGRKI
ncbi:MAG: hypothetical protein NTY79_00295 [Chloroflexi bacterium]|nr:hypothetical protein [Chloroflexota bacterium]